MEASARIYIAGHRGLVGSAIFRRLRHEGYGSLITRTHAALDLERQAQVESFFEAERPNCVFLAAARVGGIWANATHPAEFLYSNLAIQTNVLHAAWKSDVPRLLFLGSSCVYPRDCPQPMKEEFLLTGPLEPTNQPYAVAKIAGIAQCEAYNRQYGTRFLAVMPTNLYGPHDDFHLETSHVIPALIRKFHLVKLASRNDLEGIARDEARFGPIPADLRVSVGLLPDTQSSVLSPGSGVPGHESLVRASHFPMPAVILWGTGNPRREFLHVDDLADACLFLMDLADDRFDSLLSPDASSSAPQSSVLNPQSLFPLINIGCGEDLTIREMAALVARVVGYEGEVRWDTTKPDGTPRKLLEVSRLRGLGWSPRISLEDGVRSTYEWYLTQTREP